MSNVKLNNVEAVTLSVLWVIAEYTIVFNIIHYLFPPH